MAKIINKILKKNWPADYQNAVHPYDRRMHLLYLREVSGMSSENNLFLANELIRQFRRNGAKSAVYLEIGIYRGLSLLGAALFNLSVRFIGIDNFSEFQDRGNNRAVLDANLAKFNLNNIKYYVGDYQKCLRNLFNKEPDLKVDVYFYDGNHAYEHQYRGLTMMLPHLAERCAILVDDINWKEPEKANEDFIRDNPDFESALKIKTPGNCWPTWWNGIEVITRGI